MSSSRCDGGSTVSGSSASTAGRSSSFDEELFADRDPKRAERAMKAMLEMGRIDVAALRRAADGAPAA
jgi:hypothetical protein